MEKINLQACKHCLQIIKERLQIYQQDLADLQQSANEETKSSMGDKYETGRSMVQQEMDKVQHRVEELNKLKQILQGITSNKSNKVAMGSFVITDQSNFYIAVSLGQLKMDDTNFIAISPAAPLAQKMIGLTEKDFFVLNGRKYLIEKVVN
ncbi:MAG: 3-oxoacyl-ACP synthase [Cyclobacteriaceae bacterium]